MCRPKVTVTGEDQRFLTSGIPADFVVDRECMPMMQVVYKLDM